MLNFKESAKRAVEFISNMRSVATGQTADVGSVMAAGAWSKGLYNEVLSNPGDLIERKGYGIIDEMRGDDAIGAFMRMRKAARLSTPTTIEPASNDNIDLEIAEFIRWMLYEYSETSMIELLEHLFSANDYGFSLTEKRLDLLKAGKFKGKLAYGKFIPQRPHDYSFKIDTAGEIMPNGILQSSGYASFKELPKEKFIHYAYNADWNNPYGSSDVARAYLWYVLKKYSRRFWGIYLERTASGFLKVKLGAGIKDDQITAIRKVLKGVSAATYITYPENVEINLVESNGTGGDTFQKAINSFNIYMARTLLTPDLLGFSAKPTGSYALGKTHLDVYLWVLKKMAEDASNVVRKHIIKESVFMNWGPQYALPRFKFGAMTKSDKLEALTSFYTATEKGIFSPESITDEMREWILKSLDAPYSERPEEHQRQAPGGSPAPQIAATEFKEHGGWRKLSQSEKKVNFSEIQESFDSLETYAIEEWQDIALDQRDNILKALASRRLIEEGNRRGVKDLQLRYTGEIKNLLRNTFVTSYLNGRFVASKELSKGGIEFGETPDVLLKPVIPAEAVKHFKAKGLKITASYLTPYTDKAFGIAGAESFAILAKVKAAVYEGIKRGNRAYAEAEIKKIFDGYIETGELKNGVLSKGYRIQNIVRTNTTEALNTGRMEMFGDPAVSNYVEAYQVSAVLDGRETDYCAMMDGRYITKEELAEIGSPPWHYNCRTIISPVVRGETYEIDGVPAAYKKVPFGTGKKKPR